jgi:cupin fold WbuC family metalloprotein
MTSIIKQNSEVEFNQTDLLTIDSAWMGRIKLLAKKNESNKYRTCIHFSDEDNVHEMLVAHTSKTYVRPHKHRINGESLQIVEGEATSIVFNNDGTIKQAFKVGEPSSNKTFYYSMKKAVFHMLYIHSEYLIFKETTKGPFIRNDTVFPDWAPDGKDNNELAAYFAHLDKLLKEITL